MFIISHNLENKTPCTVIGSGLECFDIEQWFDIASKCHLDL
jgi:hypothetical protein